MQKLSRIVGRKLELVRVAEYQTRGLIHFHALVRGVVTQRSIRLAVNGGLSLRSNRTIQPACSTSPETGRPWRWGPQFDAQVVTSTGQLVSYMTKVVGYAVKSVGSSAGSSGRHARSMRSAGRDSTTCHHGQAECRCGKSYIELRRFVGQVEGPPSHAAVNVPYRAKRAQYLCRRHRAGERGWGFRGHVLTVSRGWGLLTFRDARERRQQWCGKARIPEHLIVSWAVVPSGHMLRT
jgi:hypothetical protein